MKVDLAGLGKENENFGTVSKSVTGGMRASKLALMIDFISNQVYSNPIGSIVREFTSNAYDAHAKAKVNDAVVVKYHTESNMGYISFIDVGTGLSQQSVEEIFIYILESTKTDSNDEHGGFGIGAKSFLSYTDSIDLITRFEGIEYYYIIGKSEEGLLESTLMSQNPTTERNGTQIRICLGEVSTWKEGTSLERVPADYQQFKEEVINQLCYFDNVYTEGFDLNNDYKVYEAETFKLRNENNPFGKIHVILGSVAYPIDWGVVGLEPINLPIGLKFKIGELKVTLSRETIKYNDKQTKLLIKDRIEDCLNEIKTLYNKNAGVVTDLQDYLNQRSQSRKVLKIHDVELELPTYSEYDLETSGYITHDVIKGLVDIKWENTKHIPMLTIPKDPYFIFRFRQQLMSIDGRGNGKFGSLPDIWDKDVWNNLHNEQNKRNFAFYRLKGQTNKLQNAFLWWKHRKPVAFIGKNRNLYSVYEKQLGLQGERVKRYTSRENDLIKSSLKTISTPFIQVIDGEVWNKLRIIKEYKAVITKLLAAETGSYERTQISGEYLIEQRVNKEVKKRKKLEGHITIYDLVNGSGNESSELNLGSLDKFTGFIVYGTKEKTQLLKNINDLICSEPTIYYRNKRNEKKLKSRTSKEIKKVGRNNKYVDLIRPEIGRIFITAKSNQKILQQNPYYMEADEFMSNGNRIFRNSVTAWYIHREISELDNKFGKLIYNLVRINTKLFNQLKELEDWKNTKWSGRYANEEFMLSCYEVGKEQNLLWEDKLQQLEDIKKWFTDDLQIFDLLEDKAFTDPLHFKDVILLLKMKRKRLSGEHYFEARPEPLDEPELEILEYEEKQEPTEYILLTEEPTQKLLIYNQEHEQQKESSEVL